MTRPSPLVRPARPHDLEAIGRIYDHYVLHSTCTYQEEVDTPSARQEWFDAHRGPHPLLVAEVDGRVLGWGALSTFRGRSAYRFTVEDSVYVDPAAQGQGLGSAILADLVTRARDLGHHAVVALIDSGQPASIRLHARLGFAQAGHLRQVGFKQGRWLDVIFMQLIL